ncbi:MAG: PH domain-containing protein [Clostridiales bacterium]|nr:PH domain-containing protein [Clostridiales bacterium]
MEFGAGGRAAWVLTLWLLPPAFLLMAAAGSLAAFFGPALWWAAGPAGGILCLLIVWYPPRYTSSLHGYFDGGAIRAVKGAWWKKELFIPMNALRTFEFWDSPLQKAFGCRTLVIRFAGGSALLPLLDAGQAARLSEQLQRAEEDEA